MLGRLRELDKILTPYAADLQRRGIRLKTDPYYRKLQAQPDADPRYPRGPGPRRARATAYSERIFVPVPGPRMPYRSHRGE